MILQSLGFYFAFYSVQNILKVLVNYWSPFSNQKFYSLQVTTILYKIAGYWLQKLEYSLACAVLQENLWQSTNALLTSYARYPFLQ